MTPFHLHDRQILITGASSGIGKQIAIATSEMGAKLILSGRNQSRLEATKATLFGEGHQVIPCDLKKIKSIEELAKNCMRLDGVVHSAGIVQPYPLGFLTQNKIAETMQVNLEGPTLLMARLIRLKKLNNGASIVFLSSISANYPHKGGFLYSAAKSGIESLSKVTALELSHKGIRSNCISPGMIKTEMYDQAEQEASVEVMERHISNYPLGIGTPDDVAHAAIYLLSNASRWVTGTNLILDGGFLLGG